jgi:regulator of replication initiation timing
MNNRFIELRKQFGKFIANFSVVEDGDKTFIYDAESIHEGLEINTYNEKGDVVPLEDGEYTIDGVKVVVKDGKVNQMPEKESKVEDEKPVESPEKPIETLETETDDKDTKIAELSAENEALKAENETLKAELEELKKPQAEPVPQRTEMATHETGEVSENVKGTRFEKAARIFGIK